MFSTSSLPSTQVRLTSGPVESVSLLLAERPEELGEAGEEEVEEVEGEEVGEEERGPQYYHLHMTSLTRPLL